jgi:hypothetical protein
VARDLGVKPAFEDHERQEQRVMARGLDCVIARPGRLTNGAGRKSYVVGIELKPVLTRISRAAPADFVGPSQL